MGSRTFHDSVNGDAFYLNAFQAYPEYQLQVCHQGSSMLLENRVPDSGYVPIRGQFVGSHSVSHKG
jgi:hypothetical protein